MRIAHLLPRQRGNVAVDNYTFVNALLWMCRTGPVEGLAGVLWQVDHRLPAVQPLVQERRDRAPVRGIAGGADHRRRGQGACHGLHEREGPSARRATRPACWPNRSARHRSCRPRGTARTHGTTTGRRTRGGTWSNASFDRMKHHRKAATRYDRLDATFLANLQLILIAIQLKNTSKKQLA